MWCNEGKLSQILFFIFVIILNFLTTGMRSSNSVTTIWSIGLWRLQQIKMSNIQFKLPWWHHNFPSCTLYCKYHLFKNGFYYAATVLSTKYRSFLFIFFEPSNFITMFFFTLNQSNFNEMFFILSKGIFTKSKFN